MFNDYAWNSRVHRFKMLSIELTSRREKCQTMKKRKEQNKGKDKEKAQKEYKQPRVFSTNRRQPKPTTFGGNTNFCASSPEYRRREEETR